jgi:acyl-CoA thioesterase
MDNESDFLEPINEGLDPKIFTRIIEFCRSDFFTLDIGIRLTKLTPGKTYVKLDSEAFHSNISGFLHGGVSATLADLNMRTACFTTGFLVVTTNINISYFTVGEIGRKIIAVGEVIHSGKNVMFAESHVKNQQGKVVAKATGIFSVVSPITGI